ncbi:uncharacterized protein DAT39_015120, partial [Clarias magur]
MKLDFLRSEVCEHKTVEIWSQNQLDEVNVQDAWRTHRTMNSAEVLNSMAQSNMPQVPAGPQHKNQTIVYSQQANVHSHNR